VHRKEERFLFFASVGPIDPQDQGKRQVFTLLLIPESCPGGHRLTCGPTLSTNQVRHWDRLGAPDCLHVPIQPGSQHQLLLFFCTSGKETVEHLKISRGQLAPRQENLIKRQQTVISAAC